MDKYWDFVPLKQCQMLIISYTIRKREQQQTEWGAPPTGEFIYLQLLIWSPIKEFS
jgi:hypothetical protein